MIKLLPESKVIRSYKEGAHAVDRIVFDLSHLGASLKTGSLAPEIRAILEAKAWNLKGLKVIVEDRGTETNQKDRTIVFLHDRLPEANADEVRNRKLFDAAGYVLDFHENRRDLYFSKKEGFTNALSTLKQLMKRPGEEGYRLPKVHIVDYPDIEVRSISATFAWYAGYGRIGFDSQLWGLDEWKECLNICSDFKINQLNMCMYGYWPFEFREYPETTLRDFEMKVWNEESENWIGIKYSHPNIVKDFLTELIEYAHLQSIRVHAYIGLNSYVLRAHHRGG